ncbi:MAG: hypothetical protein JST27_09825 [Bacteroidetes bacterium]|nr:hypothetical protein [Bacteroidota bacterium]
MTEPIPRYETIGVNEGLSQSSVYSILQDREGFMWFGTGDGLNRYDGSTIRSYHLPAPLGTVPSTFVRGNLCEDDSGNIWFANEFGLHCWNAQRDELETRMARVPEITGYNTFLTACIEGHALWLYSNISGIIRYDLLRKTCQSFPLPDSIKELQDFKKLPFPNFSIGPENRIWFKVYQDGPFHYFDTHTLRYERGVEPNEGEFIFFGKGRNYLISAKGLGIYDSLSHSFTWHELPGSQASVAPLKVVEDRWGRAWIGTFNDGIFCYENSTGILRHYVHSNVKLASIPIDLIPSIYIDRADNLWAGTDGGGVSRLDLKPPRFHLFPLNEGDYPSLSDYFIKCFYEDKQGLIWFGTHNDGFCILKTETGKLENFKQYPSPTGMKPIRVVGTIQESADGKIWIGHTLGFSLFDPERKTFEEVPVTPVSSHNLWGGYAWALIQLQDGRMLGGTNSGIVVFQKKSGRWQGHSFPNTKPINAFVTSLCQMKDGSVWMACKGPGVLQLKAVGDSFVVQKNYLNGLNVRGLHPDEQDDKVLWITSSNGLARLDTRKDQLSFIGASDGLSNTYIYGILEDKLHNFWMSTNGGLIYFNRKENQFITYTYADGLQSNEFNSGAYLKGPSGRMYFGGVRGFNWFDPNKLAYQETSIPGVALKDFRVNGQIEFYKHLEQITLPYTQNNISFSIAVLDYSRPEANRVAYFLKGWDKQWIESHNHEAHYSNLPPGRYELFVKGRNAAGVWSSVHSLKFQIQAPFWETSLFYVLVSILILSITVVLLRYFLRKKLREQKRIIERQNMLMTERGRISKDMHDEIGSGLTRIAMMSESLEHSGNKELTGKISSAARSLSQSMGEIVWALNPTQDSVEGLLAYLREQLNNFLEPFNIRHSIHFPNELPKFPLSNVQRRNLYLTAKETVGNMLKHAQANSVTIRAFIKDKRLEFEVQDDGKGFHEEQVRRSANGLRNIKRRILEIGGRIEIESSEEGTRVRFSIPLSQRKGGRHLLTTFFTLHWLQRKNTFDA